MYFVGEWYNSHLCSLDVIEDKVEVTCNCINTYFQLIILENKEKNNSIISKRSMCSQTIQVFLNRTKESTAYSVIAFLEEQNYGIFNYTDNIFMSKDNLVANYWFL